MKKWYQYSYINKTNWILENYRNLNLSGDEGIVVLMINHTLEQGLNLNMEGLVKLTGFSQERLDKAIGILCAKQYLIISATREGVQFDLSGLFEAEIAKSEKATNQSLYDLFETEFARPLGQKEMMTLSEWASTYDNRLIIYALKEASLYKKVSINYIAAVLQDWNKKKLTAEMIEKGMHLEH